MKHRIFSGSPFLLASLLVLLTSTSAYSQRTIAVIGEGHASRAPETITLTLSVTSQDVTASTVFAKHNVGLERLRQALIDAGVSAADIVEGMLALNPTYDYSQAGQSPKLVGYHLMTPVQVHLNDIHALPHILDVATQAGASNVSLGEPGLRQTDLLRSEASKLALKDAHERGEELAKQIGATLGDIVSVSDMEAEAPGRVEMEREGGFGSRSLDKHVELKVVYTLR